MVALATYLKYNAKTPLGGVIGLSGCQALCDLPSHTPEQLKVMKNTPMFLYHGKSDTKLPSDKTLETYKYL